MASSHCQSAGCEGAALAATVQGLSFVAFPIMHSQGHITPPVRSTKPTHVSNSNPNKALLDVAGLVGMLATIKQCRIKFAMRHEKGRYVRGISIRRHSSLRPVLDLLGSRESELEEKVKCLQRELESARHDAEVFKQERDDAVAQLGDLKVSCMELAAKQLELNKVSTAARERGDNLDIVIDETRAMLEDKETTAFELEKQLDQLKTESQEQMEQLKSENSSLQETIGILKEAKQNLEEIQMVKDEAAEARLAEVKAEAEKSFAAMDETAMKFEAEIGRLLAEKESLKKANVEMDEMVCERQSEIEQLKAENSSLTASNDKLEKTLLEAETAKQKFDFKSEVEIDMLKAENEYTKKVADSLRSTKEHLEKAQEDAAEERANQVNAMQAALTEKEEMLAQMDVEMEELKLANDSLSTAVASWKSSKESIEKMKVEIESAAEARVAEARKSEEEARVSKGEIATKLQAEIDNLKIENNELELSISSWKAMKEQLEEALAKKIQWAEKIAAAHEAVAETLTAKEDISAKLQIEIDSIKSKNLALEQQISSFKQSMDKFQAESTGLVDKLEAVLPQELMAIES